MGDGLRTIAGWLSGPVWWMGDSLRNRTIACWLSGPVWWVGDGLRNRTIAGWLSGPVWWMGDGLRTSRLAVRSCMVDGGWSQGYQASCQILYGGWVMVSGLSGWFSGPV